MLQTFYISFQWDSSHNDLDYINDMDLCIWYILEWILDWRFLKANIASLLTKSNYNLNLPNSLGKIYLHNQKLFFLLMFFSHRSPFLSIYAITVTEFLWLCKPAAVASHQELRRSAARRDPIRAAIGLKGRLEYECQPPLVECSPLCLTLECRCFWIF